MEKNNIYLIVIAIIICVVLGCLSPFIASGNPDGLEKSAEDSGVGETEAFFQSPFPDYTFEALGIGGEVLVLIVGALVTLAVGFGVGEILKKRKS
ncbi:MAG: PDGLE domain-containing protein [Methanobrevibacter sp.]|uniref:PDGLE domain-containing protein n=1 Tax=Methanobrevibacter sp. TaxID=66852 RepID=UPI0026DF9A7E|nr:PDGLE domain-containing protein [Methanobrevibacter sp.]MDO5848026.1 PDGLE domain-containing protein [Methanobrevibacter sp.]